MTSTPTLVKVAVLDDYENVAMRMADWSKLDGRATVTVFNDHLADPAALIEWLRPFDVLCVMRERTRLPRAIIEQLSNLKLIASTGQANAAIDVAAASERGVTVCGTGYTSAPTIEFTWALILAIARNVTIENASVRRGGWQQTLGEDLEGRTLAVLGLGRIGSRVANIARAFGMEVIAWSQNLTREKAQAEGARLVTKEALFRQADFLTIHVVLSKRTIGLVGAAELALMKPTARLINTSRGPIVDEPALIAALNERKIAGAALDVFDIEPLPAEHPFRSMHNVLATPHIGYVTRGLYEIFYGDTVENILAWLDGSPIRVIAAPGR
ncbi:MAG: D-2-hydroxyacid dehydrogenase family protein [Vulcanimicrobiaceae bacterium]